MVFWRIRIREKPRIEISPEDIILAFMHVVEEHGGVMTATRLHKLVTIAEKEAELDLFTARPYHYGPFVPELPNMMKALEKRGLIVSKTLKRDGKTVRIYALTPRGRNEARKSVAKLRRSTKGRDALAVAEIWGTAPLFSLLYYVYTRWPYLASKSRIRSEVLGGSPSPDAGD